ncbi:curli assembly protein CsgF [Pseudemcibacter aquimaris]|uniref:curli assembly protein CsgF n=1 Tax=Pseudemcibacter aquimaris TaxID=2857064 RepID=UPI002011DE36|nr:curli assembly protein CsgF [Pseudemcibacter aquimaris]MCC3859757.1 curli assembly protein CsgF [Pseudemcibacter aquimaris]WDU60151.1 curli assembly protein CsgF [Pseudemcibacter aquimaris]
MFTICTKIKIWLGAAISFLLLTVNALAQDYVYTPTNPSFGGSSFNSAHLIGIANMQNKYKDPEAIAQQDTSATDLFIRQLQSRLLSGLASQVTEAIFGENPQESGQIVFGDQIITFNKGLEAVHLVIEDTAAGTKTEIEIPVLTTGTAEVQGGVNAAQAALNGLNATNPQSPQQSILDPLSFDSVDPLSNSNSVPIN